MLLMIPVAATRNSQENTCARVSFLIKLQACEISKNTFFTEHLWTTASVILKPIILGNFIYLLILVSS